MVRSTSTTQSTRRIHSSFLDRWTRANSDPDGLAYYTSDGVQSTTGSSNYNALQVSLNKAETHNLSFTVSYTYSHALDNGSGLESSGFNGRTTNCVPDTAI